MKSRAFEQLLGLGSCSSPTKPAVELLAGDGGSSCRRTILRAACDVVPSWVIVIVGTRTGTGSDLTLKMTRDSADIEASRVELVALSVAASVPDCDEVAAPGRFALGLLPVRIDSEPTVVLADEFGTRKALLVPPASESVPAVEPAPRVPPDRPPVIDWPVPDRTEPWSLLCEEKPPG